MTSDAPQLVFSAWMIPSEYKYHGIRIYRADIYGGTVWGFIWKNRMFLADTLDTARNQINDLGKGNVEHI